MKSRIISYTDNDLKMALDIAKNRNDPKEKANVYSNKFDPNKTELQAHEEGILGELAFHLYSKLPIRTDYSLSGEKDNGRWDFRLPNGFTVEVRYRSQQWHEFALNDDNLSSFVTDLGVVVVPGNEPNTLKIKGCISKKKFGDVCEEARLRGPRLKVKDADLESMDIVDNILSDSIETWG